MVEALREPFCPLCGGPNGCIPAASGSLAQRCWCQDVRFEPELLARANRPACICRACAERAARAAGMPSADRPV